MLARQKTPTNNKLYKVISDVPTRWNSTYQMIERMRKIYESVNAALRELSTSRVCYLKKYYFKIFFKSLLN